MNNPDPPVRQWHVHPWPPLAWAETVIKLVAMAVGLTALVSVLYGSFVVPGGAALAQFLILIALAVGLVAAIVDRFIEREVIAMFFVIGNNAGHWSMVIALASEDLDARLLVIFCLLMLTGDLVKLVFLWQHDFKVRDVPPNVLYGLTMAYIAGYTLVLLLTPFR